MDEQPHRLISDGVGTDDSVALLDSGERVYLAARKFRRFLFPRGPPVHACGIEDHERKRSAVPYTPSVIRTEMGISR